MAPHVERSPGPHEEHFLETPAKPPETLIGSPDTSLVHHPVYFVSTMLRDAREFYTMQQKFL
jgi:hypothetical protein